MNHSPETASGTPSRLAFLGVAFAFLITMVGTTMPTPLYPGYQQQFDFSQFMITVIFAVYGAGVIGALVVTGRWSDQLGRRPLLFAGLLAAALSDVVFLSSQGLAGLLAGRVLSGISAGIFTGTATVAVIELAPKDMKPLATFGATAANMGGLGLGPVVAGLLGQHAAWPLHLSYLVHLGLVGLALVAVWLAKETVTRPAHPQLTFQRLSVPGEVRTLFLPAVIASFAGFSVLGFFTATAPAFMGEVLSYSNLTLIGMVAGTAFFASILGQRFQNRLEESRRLPWGCVLVILGAGLIGVGIGIVSLAIFLAGAIVAGLGQGIALRAGLGAITTASPAEQRGEVTSTFFVVSYVALSVPVLGIGLTARYIGLPATGIGFAGFVALLALVALILLLKRQATASSNPTSSES
ncbi:MFS transporter [Halomonas sp. M20]|uniref:MFS transporter n=1 Tax=Halomonas sp. M20 TaxID=2763264 RepID=UPI001D0AB433|nr:MFS transporter [Halomonas sp. M20]